MQRITLFLVTVTITSAIPLLEWLSNPHIIGGTKARSDRLYQVSLTKDGNHFCGGAILSEKHVVTAAHCLNSDDLKKIRVRGGSLLKDKGSLYQLDPSSVKYIKCYNAVTHDCDIALFEVKETFSKEVRCISIVQQEPADETWLTVTGWGLTGPSGSNLPNDLQVARLKKIKRSRCQSKYDGINVITKNMICAGDDHRNACEGDSGGPLVDDQNRLVGIVAWGAQESINASCSTKYPGVFTSVSSPEVRDFLKNALK